MSDSVIKGERKASARTVAAATNATAATTARSRTQPGTTARPNALSRRAPADKSPIRKASKPQPATTPKASSVKPSTAKSSAKTSNPKGATKAAARKPASSPKSTSAAKSSATKAAATKSASAKQTKAAATKKQPQQAAKTVSAKKAAPAKTLTQSKPAKRVAPAPSVAAKSGATATTKKTTTKTATTRTAATKTATTPSAPRVPEPARRVPVVAPRPEPRAASVNQQGTRREPTRAETSALHTFESAHKEFVAKRYAQAAAQFRQIIEQFPNVSEIRARARTYLAIAEARLGANQSTPETADALYDRGVLELNRADYMRAQQLFEQALAADPRAAHIHYGLAATRARRGDRAAALAALDEAVTLQPTLRARASHDADLASLRAEPEFERIVFGHRS